MFTHRDLQGDIKACAVEKGHFLQNRKGRTESRLVHRLLTHTLKRTIMTDVAKANDAPPMEPTHSEKLRVSPFCARQRMPSLIKLAIIRFVKRRL